MIASATRAPFFKFRAFALPLAGFTRSTPSEYRTKSASPEVTHLASQQQGWQMRVVSANTIERLEIFSGNARMSGHWASPAPCRHVRSWRCLERRLRSRRKSKLRWWRTQIGRKHCRIDGGEKRIPLGRLAAKCHEPFRRGDKIALSQRRIIFHAQRSQAKRIFTVTSAVCH